MYVSLRWGDRAFADRVGVVSSCASQVGLAFFGCKNAPKKKYQQRAKKTRTPVNSVIPTDGPLTKNRSGRAGVDGGQDIRRRGPAYWLSRQERDPDYVIEWHEKNN